MSKNINDQVIARIEQLIAKADAVKATHRPTPPNVISSVTLDTGSFVEWKSAVENLVVSVAGDNSVYHQNFSKSVQYGSIDHVDAGIGILKSLKEDVELGFLKGIRELVSAEVFTDFLDMAEHLLKNGYLHPAASLIGAVLENGLKRLAISHDIGIKAKDDIGVLNTKLAEAEVYSRIAQKQIQTWKGIRDSADHGKFDDYTEEDVHAMLEWIVRFFSSTC